MRITGIAAVLATLLLTAPTANAEPEPGQYYLSFSAAYTDYDVDRSAEDDVDLLQLGIGKALNERWNLEAIVQFAETDNTAEEEHLGLGFDAQRVFTRSSWFSPYVHAGLGVFRINPLLGSSDTGAMYSAGVGFYVDLFSSDVALKGEWRHRWETASSSTLGDDLFSLGLQFPFGESGKDSDGDGVKDTIDRCPNTPSGRQVDASGCELDSDGDGVTDFADRCPDTPPGVTVDSRGCPLDSDGDGVSDDRDDCPNTVAGAAVDERGCELDSDGDGVVDRLDDCPNTRAGAQVDVRGCEIREEIVLRGVNFESNSDRLLPGAERILDEVAASLGKYPSIRVEVGGHTDSDGAEAYNESLSERRASTVRDYLEGRGIDRRRMTVRGYGESQPVADNATVQGKAQNRRVVLRILER